MIKSSIRFLRAAFPFIATLLLWRLSTPFWNPCGILAIIPIFYYSFIKPIPWFAPYAAIFCFLIDYKFDSLLFWTFLYCLFYAINGFQNFVDLTRPKFDGTLAFMGFFGTGMLIMSLINFQWSGIWQGLWLLGLATVLYMPFIAIAKRINDD